MELAERIRQVRRRAKLSQQALAKLVGVQRSAVSNWESTSAVQPTTANLIAIARTTDTSTEWLATGRGAMHLHDAQMDTPAVDADLVYLSHERELLRLFRAMSHRSQTIVVELCDELVTSPRVKRGGSRKRSE